MKVFLVIIFLLVGVKLKAPIMPIVKSEVIEAEVGRVTSWTPPKLDDSMNSIISRTEELVGKNATAELQAVSNILNILEQPNKLYQNSKGLQFSHDEAKKILLRLTNTSQNSYQNMVKVSLKNDINKLIQSDIKGQISFHSQYSETAIGCEIAFNIAKYFEDRGKPDMAKLYYQKAMAASKASKSIIDAASKAIASLSKTPRNEISEEFLFHRLYEAALNGSFEMFLPLFVSINPNELEKLQSRIGTDTSEKGFQNQSLLEHFKKLQNTFKNNPPETFLKVCVKVSDEPIQKIFPVSNNQSLAVQDSNNQLWELKLDSLETLSNSLSKMRRLPKASLTANNSNGDRIAVYTNNKIDVSELKSGKIISSLLVNDSVVSIDFSLDNKTLLVGHKTGKVELFDIANNKLLRDITINKENGSLKSVKFGSSNNSFAVLSENSVSTFDIMGTLKSRTDSNSAIDLIASQNKKYLGVLEKYGTDGISPALNKWIENCSLNLIANLNQENFRVTGISFSPKNDSLATTSQSGRLAVWHSTEPDKEMDKQIRKNLYQVNEEQINVVSFGKTSNQIFLGTQSGNICFIELSPQVIRGNLSIRPAFNHIPNNDYPRHDTSKSPSHSNPDR